MIVPRSALKKKKSDDYIFFNRIDKKTPWLGGKEAVLHIAMDLPDSNATTCPQALEQLEQPQ